VTQVIDTTHEDDQTIRRGRYEQETYGISQRDYQAWRAQYHSAKRRGIAFKFSLLGWSLWWKTELAQLNPGSQRGRRACQYVMARKRDRGAYEPGNVVAMLPKQNALDRDQDERAAAIAKGTATRAANGVPRGLHLRARGEGHPKSKAVSTPSGDYGSIALASEAYGITRQAGFARVRKGKWSLINH
jgi:hypothetical protein